MGVGRREVDQDMSALPSLPGTVDDNMADKFDQHRPEEHEMVIGGGGCKFRFDFLVSLSGARLRLPPGLTPPPRKKGRAVES